MIVNYVNADYRDDHVRLTFISRDKKGNPRRPVIDLDCDDLTQLIYIAREFRRRQRSLAALYTHRADNITATGLAE